MSHDSHIDDETLECYAMGKLREGEAERVEEHTLICEFCLARLEQTDAFVAATRSAARVVRRQEFFRDRRTAWLAGLRRVLQTARGQVAAVALASAVVAILIAPNISQPAPYQDVTLRTVRGLEGGSVPPSSGSRLRLHLDLAGLAEAGPLRLVVADVGGRVVWEAVPESPAGSELIVTLDRRLDAGQYWVRLLRGSDAGLLREYDLKVVQ